MKFQYFWMKISVYICQRFRIRCTALAKSSAPPIVCMHPPFPLHTEFDCINVGQQWKNSLKPCSLCFFLLHSIVIIEISNKSAAALRTVQFHYNNNKILKKSPTMDFKKYRTLLLDVGHLWFQPLGGAIELDHDQLFPLGTGNSLVVSVVTLVVLVTCLLSEHFQAGRSSSYYLLFTFWSCFTVLMSSSFVYHKELVTPTVIIIITMVTDGNNNRGRQLNIP